MTSVTFLVGLPASGKSTYRATAGQHSYVASSDDFIEAFAKETSKTYNDVFQDAIGPATKHFDHMVHHAVAENRDLIVDRTNLSVASRAKVLRRIPFDWEKRAIVFKCFDFEVWKKRLMNRPGKLIPAPVIVDMMLKQFERPTEAEGFHSITEYFT
jgi:predicted kinase